MGPLAKNILLYTVCFPLFLFAQISYASVEPGTAIHLRSATFDPLVEQPALSSLHDDNRAEKHNLWIVQFSDISDQFKLAEKYRVKQRSRRIPQTRCAPS